MNTTDDLLLQIHALNLPAPELEWKFHPTRRWRFDMAWPFMLLAAEIDGGVWVGGRHVSGLGFERDCTKLNEAIVLGWLVLRFTPGQVDAGYAIDCLERAIQTARALMQA